MLNLGTVHHAIQSNSAEIIPAEHSQYIFGGLVGRRLNKAPTIFEKRKNYSFLQVPTTEHRGVGFLAAEAVRHHAHAASTPPITQHHTTADGTP